MKPPPRRRSLGPSVYLSGASGPLDRAGDSARPPERAWVATRVTGVVAERRPLAHGAAARRGVPDEELPLPRDGHHLEAAVAVHVAHGRAIYSPRGSSSSATSSACAECVSAPTLIRSTPVSAIALTVCRSTPPEASSSARLAVRATA